MKGLGFLAGVVVLVLTGCAFGQKIDYTQAHHALPPTASSKRLAVTVLDKRLYVVSGAKAENFVGLSRGGWGEPFEVKTLSNQPLAAEMTQALAQSFTSSAAPVQAVTARVSAGREGAISALAASGAERLVLLTLNQWRTDSLANTKLDFEMTFEVFDSQAQLLASNQISGQEVSSSDIRKGRADAQNWFSYKVGQLLSKPAVAHAIE